MAGRIRQEDVDAVRERADLVQVVSQHLQLRKAGRDSLVGLCPFHTEKTGSFSVSPSKQVYYCFGCGEGGNVFTFLEKVEGLSFADAVERLARDVNVTLQYEGQSAADRQRYGRKQAFQRALAEAASLYHRTLLEGKAAHEARGYLESRGFSSASVTRFQIGYAPTFQDFLLSRLSKTFSPELLVEAGLVAKDASGELRDRFRGRVMFPIHDVSGNTVGFGGRALARAGQSPSQGVAKYVNSPDGPVYHKAKLLYNLNRAKGDITRTARAFLVEGYTDVIALDQAGVPNVVATCGTALGEDHISQLSRFTERVVLSFDSDEAGARAAERAYQFHERYAVDISVLVLPSGQDPADFAMASGGDAFLQRADSAIPLVEYMLDRTLKDRDLTGVEERSRAVRAGLALVAGLDDPVRRQEYARVLAGRVGEPEVSVMLQLERTLESLDSVGGPRGDARGSARPARVRVAPDEEVELEVLKLLIQAPELCEGWGDRLRPEHFGKPTHRRAFELLMDAGPRPAIPALTALAQARPNGELLARLVARLAVESPKSDGQPTFAYAERQFLRLEEITLKRQADSVRRELQRMNPLTSPDEHTRLFAEMARLDGAARRAREAAEGVGSSQS